jgi:sugar O-acyltransferase (sialic acid O-acetyltransferase NeuD family)
LNKPTEKIILQGGGDHASVVLDCLQDGQSNVIGIFDPRCSGNLFGVPQLGIYNPQFEPEARAIIAIGDNQIRKKVAGDCRHKFTNAVHTSALLSRHALLGVGNMILHRTIVQARTTIGNHVILNTASQVDHDCLVGDYVHLGPGAILCGNVAVGEGTFIGAGAIVIPFKKVGAWCVVGAGSVVIDDIPDYSVVVGNPARVIKSNRG